MRLLVVEDERKMSAFLRQGLNEVGYVVDVAESGQEAETRLADHSYDLMILDVGLPDQTGFETARNVRNTGFRGPILMLTALGGTKDKVSGLDAGADDYITKPFAFDELLARVRALLRRHQPQEVSSKLKFSDIEMDLVTRKVKRAGQEVVLTQKEFALLEYFMRNPNRPLTRVSISEHVWDIHFDTESNVIDVYINMLRKKIDHPFEKRLLQTVVGVGYVLKDG